MASVNKVVLVGNLGADAQARYTAEGSAVTNVRLATSRTVGEGERQREETEWHRLVFFGRLAEIAAEFLKKGHPVYVEGRLRTRKWSDKDGKDMYSTEIVVESMQMLGDGRRHSQASEPHEAAAT